MPNILEVKQVEAVEALEPEVFEVLLLLEDGSEVTLRMDRSTPCNLADMASQYATP